MTDKKERKAETWDIVLMATYFFIPFYGLRIAMENYLIVDDLEMSYVLLLGLVSGIIVTIYVTILKPKSINIKLIGLGIILVLVTVINLLVH